MAALLMWVMVLTQLSGMTVRADAIVQQNQLVLTLGADLTAEQKAYILQYFGISEDQVTVITVTNADERSQLGNLISEEQIGTHTLSCALVRTTSSGGIQVKTANMNYVTSNMIASTLSTSGVYNCEVLTAAPMEVSGTGALTGVVMAYENAIGAELDTEKKALANEELVITGEIADTVGQDQATLVVNDIKIHIVRDQITDEQEVNQVVDQVIETTSQAAQTAAAEQGNAAPAALGQVEHEKLYSFGQKFSKMNYRYQDMQRTLERVTYNVAKSSGIDDPITDTFSTIDEETALDPNSILLNTDDQVLGDDALINATNSAALGDHPADEIPVFTGEVTVEEAGKVQAERFISGTDNVSYRDVNGSYAMMDLNGNLLTEAVYRDDFYEADGYITASLNADGKQGVLDMGGAVVVPFTYDVTRVIGEKWAAGIMLKEATENDYDYVSVAGYYQIDTMDIYYLNGQGEGQKVGTIGRSQTAGLEALGDYLNIQDENGAVATYDPQFQVVANPEYSWDFGSFDEMEMLAERISNSLGYSVYTFYGNYAMIRDFNTSKCGVVDTYGNIIIPMEFDDIEGWSDRFMSRGYFSAEQNGKFVFVTAGGNVTGSFDYSPDDVRTYGMSAKYEAPDGSISILAGDGVETNLGSGYESVDSISASKGMFWTATSDYRSYDLYDWHGNLLMQGMGEYSISANGNYMIVQDGYTSSTLYRINGAAEVDIVSSAGAAQEIEATVGESASMEAYTGDPTIQDLGTAPGVTFIDGTNLLVMTTAGEAYALVDLAGNQLTEEKYAAFEETDGWLKADVKDGDTDKYGVLAMDGTEIIPCQYDELKILGEHWVVAYVLEVKGTEDDYDFKNYLNDNYYQISQAVVYHISDTELTSVTLTRDQIADVAAEGEYLNVQDRSTGVVTTYDSEFQAVGSASWVSDFDNVSGNSVLVKKLSAEKGLSVWREDFPDGYSPAYGNGDIDNMGITDMEGNLVVPLQFDRFESYFLGWDTHYWANGYFCAEKEDMLGYVSADGAVTCELKYPSDKFYNYGMAGYLKEDDGTSTLVSADGVETKGYSYLRSTGRGMIWYTDSDLIDWHGNVLISGIQSASASTDGNFLVVRDGRGGCELYGVNGMTVAQAMGGEAAVPAAEQSTEAPAEPAAETETQPVQTETAAETEAQPAQTEPAAETEAQPAQTEPVAETEAVSGQTSSTAVLLQNASDLAAADLQANSASVLALLQGAKAILDTENPEAATVVNSAITLLTAGAGDSTTITTLIGTAIGMLG